MALTVNLHQVPTADPET